MANASEMNVLELRGSLLSIIAEIDSEKMLRQILTQSLNLLRTSDPEHEFSPELLAMLDEAYAESDDESQAVSNEEAFKLFRQWANQ